MIKSKRLLINPFIEFFKLISQMSLINSNYINTKRICEKCSRLSQYYHHSPDSECYKRVWRCLNKIPYVFMNSKGYFFLTTKANIEDSLYQKMLERHTPPTLRFHSIQDFFSEFNRICIVRFFCERRDENDYQFYITNEAMLCGYDRTLTLFWDLFNKNNREIVYFGDFLPIFIWDSHSALALSFRIFNLEGEEEEDDRYYMDNEDYYDFLKTLTIKDKKDKNYDKNYKFFNRNLFLNKYIEVEDMTIKQIKRFLSLYSKDYKSKDRKGDLVRKARNFILKEFFDKGTFSPEERTHSSSSEYVFRDDDEPMDEY